MISATHLTRIVLHPSLMNQRDAYNTFASLSQMRNRNHNSLLSTEVVILRAEYGCEYVADSDVTNACPSEHPHI